MERITVKYPGTLTLAMLLAQKIFGDAELKCKDGDEFVVIKKKIWMSISEPNQTAMVEFVSSPKNDIIADQFCYLLSNILYDPFSEKNLIKSIEEFPKNWAEVYKLILEDYPESTMNNEIILVNRKGENVAVVNLKSKEADSKDEYTKMRLLGLMEDLIDSPDTTM